MSAAALTKYWMTACDENRNVILNRVVNTGSKAEAQLIAESYVPEQYHGSICITGESGGLIMSATHSPTPWALKKNGVIVGGPVRQYVNGSAQDQIAMTCVTDEDNGDHLSNAAHIVRCVNSHDQLVDALKSIMAEVDEMTARAGWSGHGGREKARAALAAAEA